MIDENIKERLEMLEIDILLEALNILSTKRPEYKTKVLETCVTNIPIIKKGDPCMRGNLKHNIVSSMGNDIKLALVEYLGSLGVKRSRLTPYSDLIHACMLESIRLHNGISHTRRYKHG